MEVLLFPLRCPPTLRKQLNERTGTLPMLSLPERRVRLGLGLGLANPNPNPNPDSTPTLTPTPIPTLTPTLITPGAGRGHGGGTLLLLTRRPRRALDREDRQEAGGAPAWSLTKHPPGKGGGCVSSGRAWPLLGGSALPRKEARSLRAPPLPRVLEPAAPNISDLHWL